MADQFLGPVSGRGLGSFGDYDGSISCTNALVAYRFTENFGLFTGYDWFNWTRREPVATDRWVWISASRDRSQA